MALDVAVPGGRTLRPEGAANTRGQKLLEGLTEAQRDAVTTQARYLCIVAGAGSGKTRVLTNRIAWGVDQAVMDPRQVLVVTFTRRAAHELRQRLRRLGIHRDLKAGTFHSIALAQLRRYDAHLGRSPRNIVENPAAMVAQILEGKRNTNLRADTARVTTEIEWAQARWITPESYPDHAARLRRRPPLRSTAAFAAIYAEYEQTKLNRRTMDLNDVLVTCIRLMRERPEHAKVQRWLHQHILVDEFQDVNRVQFELLRSWLGPESTLTVVGDPDQAIYGWNGADPELINQVTEHFPGCAVVSLRTNFRSTPQILAAAGRVLGRAAQPAFRPPAEPPTVTVCSGADEPATLARLVRTRRSPGAPWRAQAVLARTNNQLQPLRDELLAKGIPVVTKPRSDLLRQPEVSAVVKRWHTEEPLEEASARARAVRRDQIDSNREAHPMRHPSPSDNPAGVDHSSLPASSMAAGESQSAHPVDTFLDLADDHLVLNPKATVYTFLNDLRLGDRSFAVRDGVNLLTFHSAKGLEWPIVHLVGLEDGFVPVSQSQSEAARREEQRLFAVALTRAAAELHLMWCDTREINGQLVERQPSPWLEAITSGIASDAQAAGALTPGEGIAMAREALRTATETTPAEEPQQSLAL